MAAIRACIRGKLGALPVLAAALLALSLAACGDDERQFTAEGFIDAMNDNGAALSLGPVLTTNPDGIDVNVVEFTGAAPSATGEGAGEEDASGGATLLIFEGSDAAMGEFDRCNVAPALTCFRAANAVLRVEELQPSDQARITTAIEGVRDDAG